MLHQTWPLALLLAAALPAHATISLATPVATYSQSFDTLATTGTANAWANNSTLAGWSLFTSTGTAPSTYTAEAGTSTAGAFRSYGAAGNSDRALGGLGSGGTYFGSPAAGTPAGYIAVAFSNDSATSFDSFTLSFVGEQWRNGGNTSAHTMVLEYGFGNSFAAVSWVAPGGLFNWTSPVTGASAAAVDGNSTGLVSVLGGTIPTAWVPGQTLWLRWTENNDFGNDHGLAIDNFSLSVSAVPEPGTWALAGAGLAAMLLVRRRN